MKKLTIRKNIEVSCDDNLWKDLFQRDVSLIEEELLNILDCKDNNIKKIEIKSTEDPYNYDIYVNGELCKTDF